MPEYLAPGVYIEETSFRSKSIEGVSTSTAGFVGPTCYGPVTGDPELLTSFADFERIYGSLDELVFAGKRQTNYMAYAAHAFFDEGGKRLYVSRIINFDGGYTTISQTDIPTTKMGYASIGITPANTGITPANTPATPTTQIISRFPGAVGNMRITFTLQVGASILVQQNGSYTLTRTQNYNLVLIQTTSISTSATPSTPPSKPDGLYIVQWDALKSNWMLTDSKAKAQYLQDLVSATTKANLLMQVRLVTVAVDVAFPNGSGFAASSSFGNFDFDPRSANALTTTFTVRPATRLQSLTTPFALELPSSTSAEIDGITIATDLVGSSIIDTLIKKPVSVTTLQVSYTLSNGSDDIAPTGDTYAGDERSPHDFAGNPLDGWKNGLLAFESIEEISMVAAPGYSTLASDQALAAHNALINHCEKMRYRVAILDTPPRQTLSDALNFRNQRSSNYAALYYPWVTIVTSTGRLNLPPSGFIAGIYARNDINRSVSKAPANEVINSAISFEQLLNQAQQEVLNPAGVNCLRFFPGRGYLVWGARTISDDSDWKYVNVRRYFAYLEHSIDRGTQWIVFENNNQQLWGNVRRTIEDFLLSEWKAGNLMGSKPEEAYFVRCDLSTMTQNDLDNGRLVCLIGVAPVRPAEFVIFRIGQWTANPSA